MRDAADVRLELDDAAGAPVAHGGDTPTRDEQGRRWRALVLVALASSALSSAVLYLASAPRGIDPAAATSDTFVSQLTDHGGSERDAAIAPDGRSFVFVSAHDGTPDLWMRQVSGGDPVRLTADDAEEADPLFARDATPSTSPRLRRASHRCGGSRHLADVRGRWWSGAACRCRRPMENRWLT